MDYRIGMVQVWIRYGMVVYMIIISHIDNSTLMLGNLRLKVSGFSSGVKTWLMYTLVLLFTVSLLGVLYYVSAPPTYESPDDPFKSFLAQYSKSYSPLQQTYRRFLFYQTYDALIFHNKQLDSSYSQGVNQFSDLTQEEFRQLMNIVRGVARQMDYLQIAEFESDYYWDWSIYMTDVKNMRDYDVGHIFAVTSLMEFQINRGKKTNGSWITLAQQQVIDCCQDCREGATPIAVYQHIISQGVSPDANYPYTSSIHNPYPSNCSTFAPRPYKISSYQTLNKCAAISKQLQSGPLIVAVDAHKWRSYRTGIYADCGKKKNHYAVLVGKGLGYWKVRNSWGRKWGEKGYIRLKAGNTCGICERASYPIFDA